MGITFTTEVLFIDVDIGLIHVGDNLHEVRGIEHLDTGDGIIRNQPGPMVGLGAPCY